MSATTTGTVEAGARRRSIRVLAVGWLTLVVAGWATAELFMALVPGIAVTGIDADVTTYLHDRRTPVLTTVMESFTTLADLWLVLLLLAAVGTIARLHYRSWRGLRVPVLAGTGALGISVVVKLATGRARPSDSYAAVQAAGSAFPSGHTIRAIAVYGSLAWLAAAIARRRAQRGFIWAGATVLIVGVGLSRIYLGAHWLTDVLGAYVLGAAWLWLVLLVSRVSPVATGMRPPLDPPLHQPPAAPDADAGSAVLSGRSSPGPR